MDEGIAVGIASHRLADIPALLRLDGSPPLYYLLLHSWMAVAGRSETAVHALSLLCALLCVPAAWWAGATAVEPRAGWVLAGLVACSPFLTTYAVDARMYSLVVLLGLLCVGCFSAAYVQGRRACVAPFGLLLALELYTHNWAVLLGAGLAAAFALAPRAASLRDGVLGFGVAALLYLPWLPSALFQARHTGAPWGARPAVSELVRAPEHLLGGAATTLIVLLAAGAGLAGQRIRRPRVPAAALATVAALPVLLGWSISQLSPVWDPRYLAIVLAPALLLAAAGLARAGALGLAALAAVAILWSAAGTHPPRTDADALARAARPLLQRGDLVVSTQPEQLPLLSYYLPAGLRYASPFGPTADPRVADWRDAVAHLARTSVTRQVTPLLDRMPRGGHVLLVAPASWDANSRRTAWGRAEHRRSDAIEWTLLSDPRLALATNLPAAHGPLAALLFVQRRSRQATSTRIASSPSRQVIFLPSA
jgi:hypothetical protein